MEKRDFKKELPFYKARVNRPEMVMVPAMNYLVVDGMGDPNTSEQFKDAVETLYSVANTLKFSIKKGADGIDYGVLPLEALWWAADMDDFMTANKNKWKWTAMIMQPDFVTSDLFADALSSVRQKKKVYALADIRFERFEEGLCGQILHQGQFDTERPTIETLHQFLAGKEYALTGKHHQIYLSDFRKTAPEKLKTIIRQPVHPQVI